MAINYPQRYDDDFINTIKKIIDELNSMGYTYEQSLQKAQDILDEAQRKSNDILGEAERVNALNENVQQQINTLIAESGTSDAEVLQSRIDAEGNEYPVLKERLDESDTQLAQTTKELENNLDSNIYYDLSKFKVRDFELQNLLDIPTYPTLNNEVVHPDIYFDKKGWGWGNHKYWMVATPYPDTNDQYEDPSIWCSNDGINWIVPDGVTNPLESLPSGVETHQWHSDPCFLKDGDTLHIIYRYSNNGVTHIRMVSSDDGVNWSSYVELFTNQGLDYAITSPALLKRGKTYYMYFVDTRDFTIKYLQTDDLYSWDLTNVTTCTINGFPDDGRDFWHIGIKLIDGVLVMNADFRPHDFISLFISNHMNTFTYVGEDLFDLTSRGGVRYYKSVVDVYEKDDKKYLCCWVGTSQPKWEILYHEIPFQNVNLTPMINEEYLRKSKSKDDKHVLFFGNNFLDSGITDYIEERLEVNNGSISTIQDGDKNVVDYSEADLTNVVSTETPDVSVFSFYQNYSTQTDLEEFKSKYEALIVEAKKYGDVLIVHPNKRATGSSKENDYFSKRNILRELASKHECTLIDLEIFFGGALKGLEDGYLNNTNTPKLTSEGVEVVRTYIADTLNIKSTPVKAGTFTFAIKGEDVEGTNAFSYGETGNYRRIGDMITFNIYARIEFDNTISGDLFLEGLPFMDGQYDTSKRGFTFPIGKPLKGGYEFGVCEDANFEKVKLYSGGSRITGSDVAGSTKIFAISGVYYI